MAKTGRPKAELTLTGAERATLQRWARRAKSSQVLALRARIVLPCAENTDNKQVERGRLPDSDGAVGRTRRRRHVVPGPHPARRGLPGLARAVVRGGALGERNGYSPSTIAAEIAGLTAASAIAASHGDTARARLYQATADHFQRTIKTWTVTTTGPYAPHYSIRVSKTGDPNAAISYNLGNGGPTLDQRTMIDGGFQELVRLGELPIADADVQASLAVVNQHIAVGPGYYRYGNSAALGSADGYGDCFQPSEDSCKVVGAPWPPTGTGTGHLWPNLSGERTESDLAQGDTGGADSLLQAMISFSSGVGLVPEQAWEDPSEGKLGQGPAQVPGEVAGEMQISTWPRTRPVR